jgi:P27 family predicted phage terminase small subunit
MPECPSWFDETGRESWLRIAPDLWREGSLDPFTGPLLASYCATYATLATAHVTVNREGMTLQRGHMLVAHPAVKAEEMATKELRRLASLLGLTPLARARRRADASAVRRPRNA